MMITLSAETMKALMEFMAENQAVRDREEALAAAQEVRLSK